ncbi:PTS fructose transporter subunit IIB [Caldisalinibacter kiritimatiensis]|uniref:PTS system, IIb component n=1 Tax=Caldisalinibacter kiritimatiensis TaxID=1304284 RepID=R1CCB4_9FIRM|nr:PTS fructose transporter subunit IIB [Caldisalinibacter kiritimatiensis]EOC99939.1 PTS system, IIb component [Caldisalinibacter kiritimatiensis]
MKIVAVTACPTGVAHTFMAKSALEKAAKKLGYTIKVETQGAMGIENEITTKDLEDAEVVILAVETGISKMERFRGKKIVKVGVTDAMRKPEKLILKALGK